LARKFSRFQEAGIQIFSISVDPPERNQAMIDKLLLPFDLLSDPGGSAAIQPYGFWDARESISRPAMVLTDAQGVVRYKYEGRDFADRPKDDVIFEAIRNQTGSRSHA